MNRWILRGLATAGFAAGAWMLTAAPAHAEPGTDHHPAATVRATLADIDLLKVRVTSGAGTVTHPRRSGTRSDRSAPSATVRVRTAAHRPGGTSSLTARGGTRGNAGADRTGPTGRNRTAHQHRTTARPDRGVRATAGAGTGDRANGPLRGDGRAISRRTTHRPAGVRGPAVSAGLCVVLGARCAAAPVPAPETGSPVVGVLTPTAVSAGATVTQDRASVHVCVLLIVGASGTGCGGVPATGPRTVPGVEALVTGAVGGPPTDEPNAAGAPGVAVLDACLHLAVGGNPGACGTTNDGGTATGSTSGATVVDACVNLTVGGNTGTCGTAAGVGGETGGGETGGGDADGDGTGGNPAGTDGSGEADNGLGGTNPVVRTVVRTVDATLAAGTAAVTAGPVTTLGAGDGLLPRTGAGGVALLLAGLLLLLLGAALMVTGRRRLA
jgi:LPXTG-motif cell wall-anchored protein